MCVQLGVAETEWARRNQKLFSLYIPTNREATTAAADEQRVNQVEGRHPHRVEMIVSWTGAGGDMMNRVPPPQGEKDGIERKGQSIT